MLGMLPSEAAAHKAAALQPIAGCGERYRVNRGPVAVNRGARAAQRTRGHTMRPSTSISGTRSRGTVSRS